MAVVSVLLTGCVNAPNLIGMWREVGKTATLGLMKDGSFSAVDNEGMAVSGKYALLEDGRVKFEILHPDSSVEIVILKVSVREDELTVVTEDLGEVERYKKLK
jgi:hypothetical protein